MAFSIRCYHFNLFNFHRFSVLESDAFQLSVFPMLNYVVIFGFQIKNLDKTIYGSALVSFWSTIRWPQKSRANPVPLLWQKKP